jgi:MerR family transcriptional regulator/heat shock protein HspR
MSRHAGNRDGGRTPSPLEQYEDILRRIDEASDEPVYVISVTAELVGVHAQTLRHYERLGLVEPARSGGNIRLYSERDVARLRTIVVLTGELGVNLAAVRVILQMRRRIADLQTEVERLRSRRRLASRTGRP